jgi:hypothetical protein
MGKYCDLCGEKETKLARPIEELKTKEYVDGELYSSHKADVCEQCREKILCGLDKMPNDLDDLSIDVIKEKRSHKNENHKNNKK